MPINIDNLPAGHIVSAGLSQSTILPDFDFETYSEAGYSFCPTRRKWVTPYGAAVKKGLPLVGIHYYAYHPSTEVLCLAYNLKDGTGAKSWRPGLPLPLDLFEHLKQGKLIEAWNATFEYAIWQGTCVRRYGFPSLNLFQVRCAAAKARAFALPPSLDKAGAVLNIQHKKQEIGKTLINKFSIPQNPTAKQPFTRLNFETHQDRHFFIEYNLMDIKAESEASSLIPDLNTFEQEFWFYDQIVNIRGVQVDVELIDGCIQIINDAIYKYNNKINLLTCGLVDSASQVEKIKQWLKLHGIEVFTLDDDTVQELLKRELPPIVREVLGARALVNKASVKKVFAMKNRVMMDGRIRDLFIYHSARTGRAAGSGPQPQNLPGGGPDVNYCDNCKKYLGRKFKQCAHCGSKDIKASEWNAYAVECAAGAIKTKSLDYVEYTHDDALALVSGCLRGIFISKPGCDLICSDYSAIEAVVLAMLAGEEWRIEVFRTHGKIYEMSAAKISGVAFEEFLRHKEETGQHHPLRKKIGKVAELASGYQGGLGSWRQFGAGEFFSDEEIKQAVKAWRKASPRIVEFWGGQYKNYRPYLYGIEGMAISAILMPGEEFSYNGIKFVYLGNTLYCRLLSGRYLTYHNAQLSDHPTFIGQREINYDGWNTNQKYGAPGWQRLKTYGGRLTENIVQATARDILANAIVNLEKSGYPVVLHVHDEIVCEVPEDTGSIEEMEKIMCKLPAWANNWPIKAVNGWRGKRYRKD